MNNSVTPQFTEGPVNADFSGVLQVRFFPCHQRQRWKDVGSSFCLFSFLADINTCKGHGSRDRVEKSSTSFSYAVNVMAALCCKVVLEHKQG